MAYGCSVQPPSDDVPPHGPSGHRIPVVEGANAVQLDIADEVDDDPVEPPPPTASILDLHSDGSIFGEMSADAAEATNGDGRTQRRTRNRNAVITAVLELMRAGEMEPTVAEIAEHAGVSHRSVFRYFHDFSDLVRAAIDREVRDALPLAVIADVGEGPLEKRVDAFVDSRLKIYASTYQVGRVARLRSAAIPEIDDGLRAISKLMRLQLRNQFDPELSTLDPDEAEFIVDAIMVLVSFESYDVELRIFEHDDEHIRLVWRAALLGLLRR